MTDSPRGVPYGITLFEFAVAAAIVAALGGVFLGVALYYEELGEKTQVELTILNIRSGLRHQLAERMFGGRMNELPALAAANPVQWLERPPADYAGELRAGDADSVGRGNWYFDIDRGELRYRPRSRNHLSPDLDVLRWRTVPIYGSGSRPVMESVALVAVEPYRWF